MQVCVVGGSTGIGQALAAASARPGGRVFVLFRSNDDGAGVTAERVRAGGAEPVLLKADVGRPEEVGRVVEEIFSRTDRIDRLLHCAAMPLPGALLDADPVALQRSASVNALSLVWMVRGLLPLLTRGAAVVYLTSRGGRRVIRGYGGLGTAKAYAESIVPYLALELAPRGVRINAVSPGALDTPAFRAMYPDDWQRRLQAQIEANPSGRATTLDDVLAAVDAVCDDRTSMIQGQILQVDGGANLL